MNYNDLEFLTRLYNTLMLVNTRGEDTIVMGNCLKGLQDFVFAKQNEIAQQNEKEQIINSTEGE